MGLLYQPMQKCVPLSRHQPKRSGKMAQCGRSWSLAGRWQIQNILTESAGPTPHARHNITDKLTAFMCLCDNVMLEEIRDCTIAEARRDRATWDVSIMELKAFIALLYVRGAYCGKNIEMESFWSEQWGNAFFNATLSRNRFREIMRYLRFDKKETRRCRLTTDKFTHVRKVWDRFVENSIAKYMLNGFPYLGKDASRPATQRLGENVVLRLVEPFVALLAQNTSLVGTIKRNKRELPPSVQGRSELFSTKVLKSDKMVLSVYQCKPRRNVTILSTQHQHVAISTEKKKKPETVEYYNHSKVGVDVLEPNGSPIFGERWHA
ncbi:hypothetical protein JOQ06_023194 [Pogonophryne albipinna]|uniref:PiggyBac transposable element-derived protein domain-containing protein n=1 Tax=Pogonophryne albipinna TaxID=1090488 RepID=A0AAD6BNT6_9TELE|nr:hypothetical protein JOQ06_023194 [Pogonophryne albipinna]